MFLQKSPSSFYYMVFGKSQLHDLLVMQNWGNSCIFLSFNLVLNAVFDLSDLLYLFVLESFFLPVILLPLFLPYGSLG